MTYRRDLPVPRDKRTVWVYFVSRDSINGEPDGMCDLWYLKPTRTKHRYRVTWAATNVADPGHLGRFRTDEVQAWFRVIPDTDLELLKVEQFATPKMLEEAKKQKK